MGNALAIRFMMSSCKESDKCIKIKTDIFYYNFLLPLHVVPLSLCRCSSEAEQLIRNQLAGSSTLPTGSNKINGLAIPLFSCVQVMNFLHTML